MFDICIIKLKMLRKKSEGTFFSKMVLNHFKDAMPVSFDQNCLHLTF